MRAVAKSLVLPRPRLMAWRPDYRMFAVLLILISVTGSVGGICLWLAGHGHAGLQAASAAVLMITGLLLIP